MLGNGALYQKEDVKVLIIYTLSQLNRAIPTRIMVDMFLNTDLVEYFTLAQSINELIETGHLAVDEEQGVMVLTRLGYEASDALYRSLPLYARERALKGALGLLAKLERKAAISTKTVEQDGKFIAQCTLMDHDDVLLKMELFVPSYELSRAVEDNFEKDAFDLDQMIIQKLS